MIKETAGNLLDADAEALVNTVNTVGVMGKGIALQFQAGIPGQFPRLPERLPARRCATRPNVRFRDWPAGEPTVHR